MKNLSPSCRFALASLGIFVCINLVVPTVVSALGLELTHKEAFVYTFCIWVVLMVFKIARLLDSLTIKQEDIESFVQLVGGQNTLLHRLQAGLRKLEARRTNGGPNPVFRDYCDRSLKNCLAIIEKAAEQGELEVRDHHFRTVSILLSAFDGSSDRTLRCVWKIEEGQPLFDEFWREYMKQIVQSNECSKKKQRIHVEILFVLENEDQVSRVELKKVLGFTRSRDEFRSSIMLKGDYDHRMKDANIANECEEFGIYGNQLLYKAKSYDPHCGVFVDHVSPIRQYTEMHQDAMDSTDPIHLPELPHDVSLEEFLHCDRD